MTPWVDFSPVLFGRTVFVLVFAVAVYGKLTGFAAFRSAVVELSGVPDRAGRWLAALVLAGEAAVIVLMVAGGDLLYVAFALAAALLTVFTVAAIGALIRGRRVACSCLGERARPLSFPDLVRNIGLLGCAAVALGGMSTGQGAATGPGSLLSGLVAATVTAVLLHLDDLATVLRAAAGPTREPS